IQSQELRRLDLIPARRGKRRADQWRFDLFDDAVIKARRRHLRPKGRKIPLEIPFDHRAEGQLARKLSRRHWRSVGLGELRLDGHGRDVLLRIKRGEAAHEVLELAHISGPAVSAKELDGLGLERLCWQPLLLVHCKEMPQEVGDVFGPLAQGGKPYRHDIEAEEEILTE